MCDKSKIASLSDIDSAIAKVRKLQNGSSEANYEDFFDNEQEYHKAFDMLITAVENCRGEFRAISQIAKIVEQKNLAPNNAVLRDDLVEILSKSRSMNSMFEQ